MTSMAAADIVGEIRYTGEDIPTSRASHSMTAAEYMLPPITAELIRQAPAVTLELAVGMNDVLIRGLLEKNLDLVFGPLTQTTRDSGSFESFPLVADDVVAVASHDHPIFDQTVTIDEDDATLITSVVSGQVDVQPVAVINGINKKMTANPLQVKFTQKETNLGIGIPKVETALKGWLDQWVKTNFDNKVLRDIYRNYHNAELPDDLTSRQ